MKRRKGALEGTWLGDSGRLALAKNSFEFIVLRAPHAKSFILLIGVRGVIGSKFATFVANAEDVVGQTHSIAGGTDGQ